VGDSAEAQLAHRFRRSRLRLYTAAFAIDVTAFALFALLPLEAQRRFDSSPLALGVLGSATSLVYAALCLWTGRLSDRWGSRRPALLGLGALGGVALPAAFASAEMWHLVLASGAFGVALSLFWPAVQRQLFVLSPGATLLGSVGVFNCAWAAGTSLGSFAGTSFFDRLDFRSGIGLCFGFTLLAAAVLAVPMGPGAASEPAKPQVRPQSDAAWRLFLVLSWLANFAVYFAWNGVAFLLPHVCRRLDFTVAQLGHFLVALNASRLAAFALFQRFRRWEYSLGWLLGLQLVGAAALGVLGWANQPAVFVLLLSVFGLFGGLSYYSSLYYSLSGDSAHGARSGIHEGVLAAGQGIGPLACGAAASLFANWPGAVLVFAGAVVAAVAVVEAGVVLSWRRVRIRGRRTPPPTEG
jgi:predicted MFS family arabinose efflux permease